MNLSRLYRRTLRKPLKVYWWQYDYPKKLNFGDELTPYIIEKLFGLKTVWSEPNLCELAGAGSIIEVLQSLAGDHPLQVWGSGFIQDGPVNTSENLKFAAIRGRLSLARIKHTENTVLGDPGLLMSLAYPISTNQKYRIGIVPHYVDQGHPAIKELGKLRGAKVINVLDSPIEVASQLACCSVVVSSSLHGLIVSDSYNIPNYWLPLSSNLTGGDYKFKDYYSIFDLPLEPIDWKTLTTEASVANLIDNYQKRKALQHIQQMLTGSFPY